MFLHIWHIHMHVYIYFSIYTYLYTYIQMYACVCICVYVFLKDFPRPNISKSLRLGISAHDPRYSYPKNAGLGLGLKQKLSLLEKSRLVKAKGSV